MSRGYKSLQTRIELSSIIKRLLTENLDNPEQHNLPITPSDVWIIAIDGLGYAFGYIDMAATTSPTPLSLSERSTIYARSRPTSIQSLHRSTSSFQREIPANHDLLVSDLVQIPGPENKDGRLASMGAGHNRKYSVGADSSDDDVPAPIKFSASVKALLGEDGASGLGVSPAHAGSVEDGVGKRTTPDAERRSPASHPQQQTRRVRIASRVEHYHSTGSPSGSSVSSSASKPARLRAANARSSPERQDADLLSREHLDNGDGGEKREERYASDFVTPAPRTRGIRIVSVSSRSGTRSPSSASSSSARGNPSREQSRSAQSGERSLLGEDAPRPSDEGSFPRPATQTLGRHRSGEEPIVQGSMRVKRVGKLSGTFLNGPARRPVARRESEEVPNDRAAADSSPQNRAEERQLQTDTAGSPGSRSFESRRQSPRLIGDGRNSPIPHRLSPTPPLSRRESPPASYQHRDVLARRTSPMQSNIPYQLDRLDSGRPGETSSKPSNNEVKSEYKLPPLPFMPVRKPDQENDPPPSIKSSRSHEFALLGKERKASQNDNSPAASLSAQSPRRALGEIDRNTPRRPAPAPPPKMSVLETATAAGGAATSAQSRRKRAQVTINGKAFTRLDCIGRGGSARVYRVMAENGKIFALKRVNLEDVDPLTLTGYKGEIDLLRKLAKVDRVVNLLDWELNEDKHALSMLMEMGESDLYHILTSRLNIEDAVFDPVFTRFYWKEMLECVKAIHEHDIVHSDLKPANFLLVKGRLKLIDFGIANAIQDHTVNVHREHQVGTPNYMAPESLVDSNAMNGLPASEGKMMKLGKPSDVWSLGCILYQMVYGKPPFARFTRQLDRIMAIPNPKVAIEFPAFGVGGAPVSSSLIRTLKSCLQRDQRLRPTIEHLLSEQDTYLFPDTSLDGTVPITQATLARILTNVVNHCRARGVPSDEELAAWPAGFFAKLKAVGEGD